MSRATTALAAAILACLAHAAWAQPTDLGALAELGGPDLARASSADPKGANNDFREIPPGETVTLLDVGGAGAVRRLWCTLATKEEHHLRKIVLRMYWDGETEPSVACPLGDFFGLGHGLYYHYLSTPMNAAVGKGLSCFFPMPFSNGARIEVENQGTEAVRKFYWNIDYTTEAPSETAGRFHARFHRENPTEAKPGTGPEESYVLLDVKGKGRYLGCVLGVHRLEPQWWGEGDEVIEADGRKLLGTGLEDYFCCAWEFTQPFFAPTFGVPYITKTEKGLEPEKVVAYRWHLEEPLFFERSLRVSIEHGSQNDRADDWTSVAYWYQEEPHEPFELPPVEERLPRPTGDDPTAVESEGQSDVFGVNSSVVVEQPKPRFTPPPIEDEEAGSPGLAALMVVLTTVWLPAGLIAGGWWYLRKRVRG